MAKWQIEVSKLARGGYTWSAYSEDDFRAHDSWQNGEFLDETSALYNAIADLRVYQVEKTRRHALQTAYFEVEV